LESFEVKANADYNDDALELFSIAIEIYELLMSGEWHQTEGKVIMLLTYRRKRKSKREI